MIQMLPNGCCIPQACIHDALYLYPAPKRCQKKVSESQEYWKHAAVTAKTLRCTVAEELTEFLSVTGISCGWIPAQRS